MQNMIDPDSKVEDGTVYAMGLALNQVMHNNRSAREAYARIYGRQWKPVPAVGGEDYFPTPDDSADMECEFYTGSAVGTDARTVVA